MNRNWSCYGLSTLGGEFQNYFIGGKRKLAGFCCVLVVVLRGFFPTKGPTDLTPDLLSDRVIFLKLRRCSCSAYVIKKFALVGFLIFIYLIN